MRPSKLSVIAAGVSILATPAQSNDAAIRWVGGAIHSMDEHPSVRLVAEHVRAHVYRDHADVECVFFLRNRGEATRVSMGFPELSSSVGPSEWPFEFFESYVDGQRVESKRKVPGWFSDEYRTWWTKEVRFQAKELRVVRDVYRSGIGRDVNARNFFTYQLDTGASWDGTIGAASIVVTLDETIPVESVRKIWPEPSEVSGSEIRWAFADFEPALAGSLSSIGVSWLFAEDSLAQYERLAEELERTESDGQQVQGE